MSTTIVPKDEQDASVLADVLPPPCGFMSQCRTAQWGDRQHEAGRGGRDEAASDAHRRRRMRGVLDGSDRDQATDSRPHCFSRAYCSNRGHLCCHRCSAMVGRDNLRPCSARGHCSWHGRGYCRISKFQHTNSGLENSTSPSTRRDQKTRRDNSLPSSAAAKNTTVPPG